MNNPPIPGQEYHEYLQGKQGIKWYVFQLEEAPTTRTPHFQGAICFKNPKRLSEVKLALNSETVHVEAMKGRENQAAAYCLKEDSRVEGPWQMGTPGGEQGKRTDIHAMHEAIRAGDDLDKVIDEHASSFYKYSKAALYVRDRTLKHRDPNKPPYVVLISGPPGVGKTVRAVEFARRRDLSLYSKTLNGQWFDGYEQQPVVLIDEVDKKNLEFSWLLELLDRYPMSVPIKGSSAKFNSPYIFLTSTTSPVQWYPDKPQSAEQIERRIDLWYNYDELSKQLVRLPTNRRPSVPVEELEEFPELVNIGR